MNKLLLSLSIALSINFASAQNNKIPSVIISDVDGNKFDISKVNDSGKLVILDFWATWCVPCKKELNNIMEVYEEWQKNYNAELIAISIDDARNTTKVKPMVEGLTWPYKILLDPNGDLKRVLGFQNIPYVIIVKDGYIVYQHTGYVEGDEFELEEELKKHSNNQIK